LAPGYGKLKVNCGDSFCVLWQQADMEQVAPIRQIDQQIIDGLYIEAVVLADEARAYFDFQARTNRAELDRYERLDFACESLKISTRIMHSIAWLLVQRAVLCGELPESARLEDKYQLGAAQHTDPLVRAKLSPEMEGLILISEDLYNRVARLEVQLIERANYGLASAICPARDLLVRLESSL
jgi:regulator of CtrA degradation